MAEQEKFITSHRERVNKANEYFANLFDKEEVSLGDREAIVKFYLLEDVKRLYEYHLKVEEDKTPATKAEQMLKEYNVKKFKAIINAFNAAIEFAWVLITSGNYDPVRKAIPEHHLMTASGNDKKYSELRAIVIDMVKNLATAFYKQSIGAASDLKNIKDKGFFSDEELNRLIAEIENDLPD